MVRRNFHDAITLSWEYELASNLDYEQTPPDLDNYLVLQLSSTSLWLRLGQEENKINKKLESEIIVLGV